MRYAILGDIHGNTGALSAVFADIGRAGADTCLCLGDIVGYGAEPNECLEGIRSRGIDTVLGNHDSAAVGDTPLDYFNPYARSAIEWTAERLGDEEMSWLLKLPLVRNYEGVTVVHSSLVKPKEWSYVLDLVSARACFDLLSTPICFIGHSHAPVIFREDGGVTVYRAGEVDIEKGARYIINVGSVGQPRDGDPRASYAIYDSERRRVEIRRVPYDVKSAQEKILAAGLPAFLAFRLGSGH